MTLAMTQPAGRPPKRWTKREYNALVDRGVFDKQRVYLHRGELIEVASMGSLHAFGITNVNDWLHAAFGNEFRIRVQMPFDAPGESMPGPDHALVTHEQMGRLPHPCESVLIVEVSDSCLELDQDMAFDYAAARIPDYWILNMRDRQLEVFRNPVADAGSVTGCRYQNHIVLENSQTISPLAKPSAVVAVSTLTATK